MPEPASTKQIPYVEYLVLDDDPYLTANRCLSCKALFLDRRNACARCGLKEFEVVELSRTGSIRAFTIVHRATPDVAVPYVSVIVDLDGGGTVKGNLVDAGPDPTDVVPGGRVKLITRVAAVDSDGTEAVTFAFRSIPADNENDTTEPSQVEVKR